MPVSRQRMREIAEELSNTDFEHGESGYNNHGCRGPVCTKRWVNLLLRSRADRVQYTKLYGVPSGVEHGASCYTNWGCRCAVCTRGNSDKQAIRRARAAPLPRNPRLAKAIIELRQD